MELKAKVFRTHRLRRIESKVQTTAGEISSQRNNREKLFAGKALSEFNVAFCARISCKHAAGKKVKIMSDFIHQTCELIVISTGWK